MFVAYLNVSQPVWGIVLVPGKTCLEDINTVPDTEKIPGGVCKMDEG
tara:strand:+ start:15814 stop:15954 length:141 start_codon:yes stop_codon:yes gene_type:complete